MRRRVAGNKRCGAGSVIPVLSVFLLALAPSFVSNAGAPDDQRPVEGRLLSHIRQLTFKGRRAGEGYFSRDGSMMIFQSEREPGNPFFQIYLMDLMSGETRRVSPGYGKTTCGWIHPDGKRVLFASTHLDPHAREKQREELKKRASGKSRRYAWDYDKYFDIFQADLEGRRLENLTHALGYDAEGSWSPDGKLIVFSSNRHAYAEKLSAADQAIFSRDPSYLVDIYRMHSDGTGVRRLTFAKGYDGGPFFSPDGRRIVWRRFSEDGSKAEIYTMNADGTAQRPITHLNAMSWAPYFHPSGDYLIFATNVHGFKNVELYLVDAEGRSNPVRVTFTPGFDGLPVFSPDGKHLSWTSNRTGNGRSQIFIADWDDGRARELLGIGGGKKQTVPEITADDLRLRISYLASEKMEGRLTGTEGERRATAYVASVFRSLGLRPAGDDGSYFQEFEFAAGVSLGPKNQLVIHRGDGEQRRKAVDRDWRPLAFSRTGHFGPAPIVFAGYGIVSPSADKRGAYNSYSHLEVRNKWVLVFRYLPEGISSEFHQHLVRYSSLRYKAMLARDRGARGLIVVSGPNSRVRNELVSLSFDVSLAGSSIAAISVTDALAERWLKAAGKGLKGLQDRLDTGEAVAGFEIPGMTLEASVDVQQERRIGRNVLARLSAGKTAAGTMVVVGAHVDHLGRGLGTGSLARGDEKGMVHFGADDNASGVGGLLEIAEYLAGLKAKGDLSLKRDVLFAAWSGEELGLLGSTHFTRTFGVKGKEASTLAPRVAAYLNMDMIGRLDKALILQGVGSSSIWSGEIEKENARIGLPIVTQEDSYLPTDATSFYLKRVPILNAFTGAHRDYHTPGDTADKINYGGVERIARLMAGIALSLASREQSPDYRATAKPAHSLGRRGLRVYLGTIPDYAKRDVQGVRISGVARGGPADRAGVRGGDIIVELAGRKVENIYDYTYILDSLKIGSPVEIVVQRDSRRVKLEVRPESRE